MMMMDGCAGKGKAFALGSRVRRWVVPLSLLFVCRC